jgi:general secretion pathway protein F
VAVFEYEGIDTRGKDVRGIIDADSPRSARARLKGDGVFATELVEAERAKTDSGGGGSFTLRRGIPLTQLALLTRQLATLLDAGLPLVDALGSMVEQSENERTRLILSQVRERVNEGASLSDALGEHNRVFSNFYRNMAASGEASGMLPVVLERLADFLESSLALRRKIMAALTYPVLMGIVAVVILSLLMIVVVPQVTKVFTDLGKELPTATRALLSISEFSRDWWPVGILLAIAGFFGIGAYQRTEGGREQIDRLLLKIPRVGSLVRLFPVEVRQMVAVGEESGSIDRMLLKVAVVFEARLEAVVASLTSLLEPLMILGMGGVVGFVIYAILMPIFELTGAMQ